MANLNKVMFIGRLTRNPESRTFSGGGKVVSFGLATKGRSKKNPTTGEWEDEPMFIDVKVFNRGEFQKQADWIEERNLTKGQQIFIEGHLVLEQWEDKQTNQKRSKHVVYVDNFQMFEPRREGGMSEGSRSYSSSSGMNSSFQSGGEDDSQGMDSPSSGPIDDDIPF